MNNMFLKEPVYTEPGNSVILKLENNIINRHLIIEKKIEEIFQDVYYSLNNYEKKIIHFMYNTGENITTLEASNLINKGRTFTRKILLDLEKILF